MKKILMLFVILPGFLIAQNQSSAKPTKTTDPKLYQELKKTGKHVEFDYSGKKQPLTPVVQKSTPTISSQSNNCACLQQRDNTYSVVPMSFSSPPDYRNDDDSSPLIALPFNFCLYGQTYNSCYINNNGNISFGTPYGTFSGSPFPNNQFTMVAPFWGDVETTNLASGLVYYKVTPTALIVIWDSVGYFNSWADKLNYFQLIISDGTDPLVPNGNNVAFCYGDMQWTTGDASGGTNGFGGIPAVVGANLGNGVDFIQFGLFDSPGNSYTGPFPVGPPYEGVDWLDNQSFYFNACSQSGNIPPIASGIEVCDTINICEGDSVNFNITFFSPEQNQITTPTATATGTGLTVVSTVPGNTATITSYFMASSTNNGCQTITFTGTDNGTPAATTTISIVVCVDTFAGPSPIITGTNGYCQGGPGVPLSVNNFNYTSYSWSNGTTTNTTGNLQAGTYICIVELNGCYRTDTFTIVQYPNPTPTIGGQVSVCGSNNALLTVSGGPYQNYSWSTGATSSTISVSTGNYSVVVTDANGCTGLAPSVNVAINPQPNAGFTTNPTPTSLPGTNNQFTDISTVSSGNITNWYWDFGDGNNSTQQNPQHTYALPGNYNVCLVVQTQATCYDTTCFIYTVEPFDITVPNVFTPNGDGMNDYLVFQNLEFFTNADLTIYNRWGNKLYNSPNYKNDWNGANVSDGTYFFILSIPDPLGTNAPMVKKGYVQIIRGK
jgi:gliding motility-associated-like protein